MKNSTVKWFDKEYDLNCDVSKLEELGYTNSTWRDDIAPSYSNGKLQIFFLQPNKEREHEGRSKFSINKITEDHDFVEHIIETNHFYKVLQIAEDHK